MDSRQYTSAARRRTLGRWRRLDIIVGCAALVTVAMTASAATAAPGDGTSPRPVTAWTSPAPGEHNARVAEYLLQQRTASNVPNARVAEYLLQQKKAATEHNARVAEYLLLRQGR